MNYRINGNVSDAQRERYHDMQQHARTLHQLRSKIARLERNGDPLDRLEKLRDERDRQALDWWDRYCREWDLYLEGAPVAPRSSNIPPDAIGSYCRNLLANL